VTEIGNPRELDESYRKIYQICSSEPPTIDNTLTAIHDNSSISAQPILQTWKTRNVDKSEDVQQTIQNVENLVRQSTQVSTEMSFISYFENWYLTHFQPDYAKTPHGMRRGGGYISPTYLVNFADNALIERNDWRAVLPLLEMLMPVGYHRTIEYQEEVSQMNTIARLISTVAFGDGRNWTESREWLEERREEKLLQAGVEPPKLILSGTTRVFVYYTREDRLLPIFWRHTLTLWESHCLSFKSEFAAWHYE